MANKTSDKSSGEYRVPDRIRDGLSQAIQEVTPAHPLELSERNYAVNREAVLFRILKSTQGLHAPLQLQMERKITSSIQRLPPLESSMLSFDVLTGNYASLSIEEALRVESDVPYAFDIHGAIEKRLKMK